MIHSYRSPHPNDVQRQPSQAAVKVVYFVIPSEARKLSLIGTQEKRDSSARSVPRNDRMLSFSAGCSGGHRGFEQMLVRTGGRALQDLGYYQEFGAIEIRKTNE
jgi:hypothetical protein